MPLGNSSKYNDTDNTCSKSMQLRYIFKSVRIYLITSSNYNTFSKIKKILISLILMHTNICEVLITFSEHSSLLVISK